MSRLKGLTNMRDPQTPRSIVHIHREPSPSRLHRSGVPAIVALTLLTGLPVGTTTRAGDSGAADELAFSGRVVELETGNPVPGATVIVERSIRGAEARTLPPWAGESTISTDAEGRFRLSFPPEQVAEPRLRLGLRIRHPGFIPRKSVKVAFADVMRGRNRGEEPFFATIPLERGVEYTAQVLIPGGKPVTGIPYSFENEAKGSVGPDIFMDDATGQTDDDGRIRLRMPKSHSVAIYVGAPRTARARFPYAPYHHFWGTDDPLKKPDVWAPTDLGRIVLARGIRLSGRVVDIQGRPIAKQTITAYPELGRDEHSAMTEADGSFSLSPLRSANYLIYGEGQDSRFYGYDPDGPPLGRLIRIIRPVRVYLKDGRSPEPLVLQEVPTVRVEVRFVDSKGKPTRGTPSKLRGSIQIDPLITGHRLVNRPYDSGPTSMLNDPEPQVIGGEMVWSALGRPDGEGRIIFRAPQGLASANVIAWPDEESVAYKYRLEPNGPLQVTFSGALGVLEDDRSLTVITYRAPTVLLDVKTEDGQVLKGLSISWLFRIDGDYYGGDDFVRRTDGRYRSRSLMPDHEYEIRVRDRARAYVPRQVPRVNLPEGKTVELTLVLRKRPTPPEPGQPAPAFTVQTIDGRTLILVTQYLVRRTEGKRRNVVRPRG
jgi:hypothetical protein